VLTAAATYFNVLALQEFGGRPGAAREPGLVEQVVGAAFQTFGDYVPHPHPFAAPYYRAAIPIRPVARSGPPPEPFLEGYRQMLAGMATGRRGAYISAMSLFQPALLEAPLRSPDGFAYQPDLLSVSAAEDLLPSNVVEGVEANGHAFQDMG